MMKPLKTEGQQPINYTSQPLPRRGMSFFGLASCAVFVLSACLFARNWNIAHRIPINRSIENLNIYSNFLEFWSRAFSGMSLLGCALAGAGLWQGRKRRALAFLGLGLNALAMVVLIVLGSTGGPM